MTIDEWELRKQLFSAERRAEVERERAKKAENALLYCAGSLAAAISLLEKGGKEAAPSDKVFAVMLEDYKKALNLARAALRNEGGDDE